MNSNITSLGPNAESIRSDGTYNYFIECYPSSDEPLNQSINTNLTFDLNEYDPTTGISSIRFVTRLGYRLNIVSEQFVYFKAPKITLHYTYLVYNEDDRDKVDGVVENYVEYQAKNGSYFTTLELIQHILDYLYPRKDSEDPDIYFRGIKKINGKPGVYSVVFET